MEAEKISEVVNTYGAFIESAEYKRQLMLFHSSIPESLLPLPKLVIVQALDVYIQRFAGNDEALHSLYDGKAFLDFYIDDATAIKRTCDRMARV